MFLLLQNQCLESAKQRWALLGEFWLRTWKHSQVWSEAQTHSSSLLHSTTGKKTKQNPNSKFVSNDCVEYMRFLSLPLSHPWFWKARASMKMWMKLRRSNCFCNIPNNYPWEDTETFRYLEWLWCCTERPAQWVCLVHQRTSYRNMELHTSRLTLFLSKASLAGRFSVTEQYWGHPMISYSFTLPRTTPFSTCL